ncbi:type VI secretion system Rhs element Vgr family protein [Rhizobium etli bv. mimosae str. IE4771]|uniref:Type VI secretion system Rhs element Vgr family protein n=1 Tax=Rhizobium etli bv. mimosae str. IE4771 TaxID=1432050 RepID=A0A060I823_RHIET|nr:type VI secretion system tip protein TssI/VgrG [Rhizobium sp. IE4771]AIC28090.1 type VI secretion system Rhs element Vgr family protein [Rhizobium sp. IE4771]
MNDLVSSSDFIQANRVLRVTSPLGDDQLLPERLAVDEGVNQLFTIKLAVRAKREIVKPEELIGHLVTVDVEVREGIRRPFNGLVTRLSEGPPVTRGLRSYSLTVRPQMWLLSRRSDCRIWMDKTAIDVLQTLFSEHGLPAPDVHNVPPPPRQHYSVQWNETDLDYLLRRFEEDGLFYWFEHEDGSHRLKVANGNIGWSKPSASAEGELQVRLAQGSSDRNHITEWMREFAYIPGKRSGADWNFETPSLVPHNVTDSLVQMPGAATRELYEYPARIGDVQEAERAEKLRMQAAEADHERVMGQSNVRILEPGRRFIPYEVAHPDHTYEEHVIVKAVHTVVDRSYETNSNEPEYTNTFEAVPSRVPMTPHRQTKRPRIEGAQVAIVAGPPGEEIHTDKYGRIKVWFPWDRRAKKDGSDTRWFRVSQPWGGGTWGSQVIPRIGMEVMVSFIDGDPDRPLVIGVVPNPSNPVPYDLPGNKTRMVLRSNTHKGDGFNEMTFEDEAGKENMFFHAQKDQTTRVLNDRTKRIDRHEVASVGGNRAVEVSGNQKHEIGGSMNTVVGGTGPMAMALMGAVQGISGQTAELLEQAGQVGGGSGPGLTAFATTLASSALGFLGAGGLVSREGVVAGSSPRADAGTALAGSGTGVGDAAFGLFPSPGIMNTIVGAFKSDTIGVARAEQIGVSKVTNVGQTSMENVGKAKNTTVGEEYVIQVGDRMLVTVGREFKIVVGKSVLVMDKDGNVTILGTNFNFTASGPVTINGKVIDLNP